MAIERIAINVATPEGRAAWLNLRKHDLTASDIGAVNGVDEYRSALTVYAEKAGRIAPQPETGPMIRGRWMEAANLVAFREKHPTWRVEQANCYVRDTVHRLAATPDFLAEDDQHKHQMVNVQAKCVSRGVHERWGGSPPLGYLLQVTAENLLLGAARGILSVLVVDAWSADLVEYDVPRHPKAEAELLKTADQFWENLAAGRFPKADYRLDTRAIAELYPPDAAQEAPRDLTASNRIGEVCAQRAKLKATIKAATFECTALEAEIIEALAGSTSAVTRGWKISRRMQHRKQYTVPAQSYPRMVITKDGDEEEPT